MSRPLLVLLLAGCYPATSRPGVEPVADAMTLEVELPVAEATRALALALDADSIPVRRTVPDDGWLESEWFDAVSLQPTRQRPLGIGVVRVRAFVATGRANHSVITLEAVYRVAADPSRPERELERQISEGHPVHARIKRALESLPHDEP
ncbi:MAG TPA: hypothetical protein PLL69_07710 [Gemmatimonadales bacterium]|nr:hypothetical protein [Gemmatimonadales bacterium]